jgi:hypothetical protein
MVRSMVALFALESSFTLEIMSESNLGTCVGRLLPKGRSESDTCQRRIGKISAGYRTSSGKNAALCQQRNPRNMNT